MYIEIFKIGESFAYPMFDLWVIFKKLGKQ